ncbi:amidase [Alkalihalobacterium alkalinitrilicum]|uniref:amidase n=1 Tax=Alkalihalobacterium alkalinitrilicum TaxID=427920 RepID=UPI00099520E9|nr:amidase [Alkalihalobacterium alkalinitrilicum]
MEELFRMSISELAPLVKNKSISPVELTKSVLSQVKKYNPQINAYVDITEENALATARIAEDEISQGEYRGKLHGIPLALKDILYFKGEKTSIGSKIHQDFRSPDDATVVSKLKDAGAVFTGKLNMHEYAWGGTTNNPHYGPCRNPWDLERIPGGSSGGSGAAVIADMTIGSLGTDTGGSIRGPAALCGIVGLKPTHGLVSKYGCFPLAWSLDHIGPMTKTVEDSAIMLEYIAGQDEMDITTQHTNSIEYSNMLTGDIKGKVIGIDEGYFFNDIDSGVENVVREGIKKLEQLGAKIEIVKIPSLKYTVFAEMTTILTEATTIHQNSLRARPEDFGADVLSLLKLGEVPSAVDYLQAQQIRTIMKREFSSVFEKVDVLVSPQLPFTAPKIGDDNIVGASTRLMAPANLTGLPAISVPCGFSEGLPVGMQIMGPGFSEAMILNIAYAFEKTNPLQGRKPNLNKVLI